MEGEDVLYDIASYVRIMAADSVKSKVGEIFGNNWEKVIAYSKMDGNTPQAKIAASLGVPARTIANWEDEFLQHHLVAGPSKYNSSHKALFSLQELGINLAGLKKKYSKAGEEQDTMPKESLVENVEADVSGVQNNQ